MVIVMMMMMMMPWKMRALSFLVTMYTLFSLTPDDVVRAGCVPPVPSIRTLVPRDGPGSSLFLCRNATNASYSFTVYKVGRPLRIYHDLKFVRSGNDWILTLNRPPTINEVKDISLEMWQVIFRCTPVATRGTSPRTDVPVNDLVATSTTMFKYRDFAGGDSLVKYYSTGQYKGALPDGGQVFTLSRNGSVSLQRQLDFDKGDVVFRLAVTGHDYRGISATKYLEVRIVNVNDNDPVFLNTGCRDICSSTHYAASVGSLYVGPVTSFTYGPIQAVDADGDPIEYSLVKGTPDNYKEAFTIDKYTGSLAITKPLEFAMPSSEYINITLQARSNGNLASHRTLKISNQTQTFIHMGIVRYGRMMATAGADRQQVKVHLRLLGVLLPIGFTASL